MVNNVQFKEEIHNYIELNKEEILKTLKELVKISSINGEKLENAPFGKECATVLEFTQELYRKNGFETELDQNGGYLLSYFGDGEKSLGIFSHADVVPVNDDWIYTKPFEPLEKGGCIIGRGTLDDKSAVVISLYCAKILKELNLPFNSRLVLFTGADEESGMRDLKNYMSSHKTPDFSLVPDTCFPIYRGNKGRLSFTVKSKKKLTNGITVKGGTGASVIGGVNVTLPYYDSLFNEIIAINNDKIKASENDGIINVSGSGIAKHSAIPEGAVSALAVISKEFAQLNNLSQDDRKLFSELFEMSENLFGEFFGIEEQNDDFGKLTCVLTKIETDNDGFLTAHFNIRYIDAMKKDEMICNIEEKFNNMGWEKPLISGYSLPHTLSYDNKFVKALLSVYSEYTGKANPDCYINAGGTYRQYLKNALETGTTLCWNKDFDLPKGHGAVHQPDECINIDGFLNAIELTALMLIKADEILGGSLKL